MTPNFQPWQLILFASAVLLITVANVIFYVILGEVNKNRYAEQKITPFLINVRLFEIIRTHKELFPESKKATIAMALAVLGIGLAFGAFTFGKGF